MSFSNIFSALMASVKHLVDLDGAAGGLGSIPVRWPNSSLVPPADGSPYAAVDLLPSGWSPVTLGDEGEDEHTGVLQISLYYPLDQGHASLVKACSAAQGLYHAGSSFQYGDIVVRVSQCDLSPLQKDGQRFACHVSVYFYARLNRTPTSSVTLDFTPN